MYTIQTIEQQPIQVELCNKETCLRTIIPANNQNAFWLGLGTGVVLTLLIAAGSE